MKIHIADSQPAATGEDATYGSTNEPAMPAEAASGSQSGSEAQRPLSRPVSLDLWPVQAGRPDMPPPSKYPPSRQQETAALAEIVPETSSGDDAGGDTVGAVPPEVEQAKGASNKQALMSGASMQTVDAASRPTDADGFDADAAEHPGNRHQRRAFVATHDGALAPSGRPVAPPLALGATPPAGTGAAVAATDEATDQAGAPAARNLAMMSLDWFADAIHQPDDPVIGPLEPGLLGMLIGLPGISKSTIAIHMGVAVATGRPFAGLPVPAPQRVVIFTPEDPPKETGRRLIAACRELGADEALVLQNLRVATFKRGGPLLEKGDNGQELTENGEELRDAIRDHGARLVIFDPLVEIHTAQESDNGEMHAVFSALRDLAHNNKCAILITHHITKDAKGALGMFNGRGAGSMAGAVRVMFGAEELSAKGADKVVPRHPGSTARDFLSFSMLKANYEKIPETSVTLKRIDNVVGAGKAPSLRALTG